MLVTVFCAPRDRPETTFALQVSPELELRDFVALCELESGIPAGEIQIIYVEQPLKDPTRALGTYGVKDGDVVILRQADRRPPPAQPAFPGLPHIDFRSIAVPGSSSSASQRSAVKTLEQAAAPTPPPPRPAQPSTSMAFRGPSPQGLDDPALLQQMLLSNPHELSLLKERNPPLAEALLSGDLERFKKVLLEQQQDRAKREQERIRLLTADPFDLEAQAKIEEDIRQHNVEENMTIAMEEAPESFGQVVMLYINCRVNGHPVKAFVDSGAQMTIMSQACAERCNIMRLVDRRWAGIAKGVGTQKIIGRVHLAQVQIEGDFLPCSFSILEDQPMDMLLGLDMLKRHQCSIDLKKSVLLIGTTGSETRFLSEAELPECARLAYGAEGREDPRPEEIADRELAEALQRSIQESDTADGQTTSPQPPPFTLPRTLDQMSSPTSPSQSPSSGQLQNPTLDPSQSAPAAVGASAPGRCQDQRGSRKLPLPASPTGDASSPPNQVQTTPLSDSRSSKVTTASADVPPPCIPAGDAAPALRHRGGEEASGAAEDRPDSSEAARSLLPPRPEELCPAQPMEQEATGWSPAIHAPACPGTPDSVDMDSSATAEGEMDQPEGERCSSSDSIPSLATALMELHELLLSNNRAQSHSGSTSCSPSHPPGQEAGGGASPGPSTPTPAGRCPAISGDAEATGAVPPSEGPSGCLAPELAGLREAEFAGGRGSPQCPESSGEERASLRSSPCESEVPPDPPGDSDIREPPEERRVREAAGGRISGTNRPDSPNLQTNRISVSPPAEGSPEGVAGPATPGAPGPPLLTPEPFPAEHIRRIQAAGFSAREAAEALEQANGVVELALLALLARSITVPT